MSNTKICRICNVNKPLDFFHIRKHRKGRIGHRSECKSCQQIYKKNYFEANKEAQLAKQKANYNPQKEREECLKRHYGLKLSDYEQMMLHQKGVCAICKKAETVLSSNGKIRPLSVDHSHSEGYIRGLLCSSCNTGIGFFKDNVMILKEAIKYLNKFNEDICA